MSRTFHLLTESEPFSERDGGAISRWVANVVRPDSGRGGQGIVIAPSADDSCGFSAGCVRTVPQLAGYKRLMQRGAHRLPWAVKTALLRRILLPALKDLEAGDTVWVHNRPEFVLAVQSFVHRRSAGLLLQLHNSHLVGWSRRVTGAITPDCYVFLTQFLEDEARAKFPGLGRSALTYSGADTAIFHPRTGGPRDTVPTVLFVGRVVPDKGVHVLVAAMKLLEQRGVSLRALVVGGNGFGDSKPTPYIEELHRSAPASVRFAPYCSGMELGEIFRMADIFCVPSCWNEALGLVVLEGMASGLPVVATRSGGIPELLAEGGGLLVERNDPVGLADALERLAKDASLRQRLGAEALKSLHKSFTWETVQRNYRNILEAEAMGARKRNAEGHGRLAMEGAANV